MKIAVVYNRESRNVINLFGVPNREKYGQKNIARIVAALKKGGHSVMALEGDKDLVPKLEEFMPKVVKGERPGMVFNLSYGIQGQARYTHVPGILEMMGLPYVGSGPLAHSLALDKVVAKVLFAQNGVPTPRWAVLKEPDFPEPDLGYPMIVKPKNESTSFGLEIVHSEEDLRRAAGVIFAEFGQAVLVEEYIDGREINVGLIGNDPPESLPPAELVFERGPKIYTMDDKKGKGERRVSVQCPADLPPDMAQRAQTIARAAFDSLGCADCARVDLRLSPEGEFSVLEINSLPSLGEHGSYTHAAAAAGLDFAGLINRLVEVASARYFGTPQPPEIGRQRRDPRQNVFEYLTRRRDQIEERVRFWTEHDSRTDDAVGMDVVFEEIGRTLSDLGLRSTATGRPANARLWETEAGLDDGVLVVVNADVPLAHETHRQAFRREPEWLTGEGVGTSRGPLAMLELALRAGRSARVLRQRRLGVLVFGDEGRSCADSRDDIAAAARRASRVIVLRPVGADGRVVSARRGLRTYRLTVESASLRIGQAPRSNQAVPALFEDLHTIQSLGDRKARTSVVVTDIRMQNYPQRAPHAATVTIKVSYPTAAAADRLEEAVRSTLGRRRTWRLRLVSDRPPMPQRAVNTAFYQEVAELASSWDIPVEAQRSVLPSAAGLVPPGVACLCGLGPIAEGINTPQERISRFSLVQRTLLLAQILVHQDHRR
jgi:D-alanine-D-alanine ligase